MLTETDLEIWMDIKSGGKFTDEGETVYEFTVKNMVGLLKHLGIDVQPD